MEASRFDALNGSVSGFGTGVQMKRAFSEEWQGRKHVFRAWCAVKTERIYWFLLGETELGSAGEQPDEG